MQLTHFWMRPTFLQIKYAAITISTAIKGVSGIANSALLKSFFICNRRYQNTQKPLYC
jgi:hypothetical protein